MCTKCITCSKKSRFPNKISTSFRRFTMDNWMNAYYGLLWITGYGWMNSEQFQAKLANSIPEITDKANWIKIPMKGSFSVVLRIFQLLLEVVTNVSS